MRIAHLADLHLGFMAHHRTNPAGANLRQADVAAAFNTAVDQIIAARVDAVLVAGDVFHSIRPSNHALLDGVRAFRRLRAGLPRVPVIVVAGNHDTPRSASIQNILALLGEVADLHVAMLRPKVIRVNDLSVACLPDLGPGVVVPPMERDPDAKWNVCLAHIATVAHGGTRPWADANFDYVALGDFHVQHEVEPGAWYSGSLEYVSSNPWDELVEQRQRGLPGKGWNLVTLGPEWPTVEFQPVPTRAHIDLPVIDADGLSVPAVNLAIAANIQDIVLEGAVVRQVVRNVSRDTARALDHEAVRRYKATALHFHLDCRRPDRVARTPGLASVVARAQTLADVVDEALARRPLSDDVDRDALKALARKYMGDATESAVALRESLVA